MTLFIDNKRDMDFELQDNAKIVHKEAFAQLRNYMVQDDNIPMQLCVTIMCTDYWFSLVKLDIQKDLFVYNYSCGVAV